MKISMVMVERRYGLCIGVGWRVVNFFPIILL